MSSWLDNMAVTLTKRVMEHDVLGLAAEGAFRFLLSFLPSCIFLIALTTVVGLSKQSIAFVISSLSAMLPRGSQPVVEETIRSALDNPMPGLLTTSLLITMWTASGVFGTFTKALNRIFGCPSSHLTFWRNHALQIALLPLVAVPVAVAAVLVVFGSNIATRLAEFGGFGFLDGVLGWLVRWSITVTLVIVLLAFLYKIAPTKSMRFRAMMPGALLATLLWVVLSVIFREFVSSGFARYKIYGSLTAVVIFLFWAYLSAIAFLVGAEFNAELLERRATEVPCDTVADVPSRLAPAGPDPESLPADPGIE